MHTIKTYFHRYPLQGVLILALIFRLLAAFYAEGYLMFDDHFLVIEPASSWTDGEDYNNWLPESQKGEFKPHSVNFAYAGTQYVLLEVIGFFGVDDPKSQMTIVRLMHALYSLLIVFFGFKIAALIGGIRSAKTVGLMLALMAFMPNFSVKNLVEFVCIPPLLYASWIGAKYRYRYKLHHFMLMGIGIGIATALRYQCGIFGIGFGIVLLFQRQFIGTVVCGFVALSTFALGQIQDFFVWGEFFTQLKTYISYNANNSGNYPNGPWYRYILTIGGFLIPPLSLLLIFGYFKSAKNQLLLFVPSILFIIFHSCFPNKQERFILPALPYVVILGVYGWNIFKHKSKFWANKVKLQKSFWAFFWVLNLLGLFVFTFAYTKKSRVEAMYALYEQQDLNNFASIYDNCNAQPPQHYCQNWESYYEINGKKDPQWLKDKMNSPTKRARPNYLLIYYNSENISGEIILNPIADKYKKVFPNMTYVKSTYPGILDKILNSLNPHNKLEIVDIYKLNEQP